MQVEVMRISSNKYEFGVKRYINLQPTKFEPWTRYMALTRQEFEICQFWKIWNLFKKENQHPTRQKN